MDTVTVKLRINRPSEGRSNLHLERFEVLMCAIKNILRNIYFNFLFPFMSTNFNTKCQSEVTWDNLLMSDLSVNVVLIVIYGDLQEEMVPR